MSVSSADPLWQRNDGRLPNDSGLQQALVRTRPGAFWGAGRYKGAGRSIRRARGKPCARGRPDKNVRRGCSPQLEQVEHSCPAARQALRRTVELLGVFGHHRQKVFRVPERLQNRPGLCQPFGVCCFIEAVLGALFHNLAIPFTRRVLLAANSLNQLERSPSRLLEVKNFERLVVEPINAIFLAPTVLEFGQQRFPAREGALLCAQAERPFVPVALPAPCTMSLIFFKARSPFI
jgi:hypothetical protein